MTTFWISLGSSLTLTGLLVLGLRRVGLHDVPNHRSLHSRPIPRGGGLGVLVAVLVATILSAPSDAVGAGVVLTASLVLGTVGLVDDVRSLPPAIRLVAQALVALVAAVGVVRLPGDAALWAPAFVGVAIVATVAYVNAFNFMDGVNGISALNAMVCGGWLAWLGHQYDVPALLVLGSALAGATLGFLPWNLSSRIFLGDVGSYGIGGLIATSSVLGWGAGIPGELAIAPTLVYLADTGWVILKRARSGQPLTQAHRGHVYQRLVLQGWAQWAAAGWSAVLATTICLLAAAFHQSRPTVLGLLAVLVLLTYLATPHLAARASAAGRSVS